MTKRKLPIGIQTFRTLREQGCYYVNETGYAKRLADEGGRYFLSRPRRFGKSLFLDTLKELFEGSEPLFRGLAVHDGWDWSVSHPVVRLSFGAGDFTQPDYLQEDIADHLEAHEGRAGVRVRTASAARPSTSSASSSVARRGRSRHSTWRRRENLPCRCQTWRLSWFVAMSDSEKS